MGSETLPSACYILSDESSIPFYSTSNGYNKLLDLIFVHPDLSLNLCCSDNRLAACDAHHKHLLISITCYILSPNNSRLPLTYINSSSSILSVMIFLILDGRKFSLMLMWILAMKFFLYFLSTIVGRYAKTRVQSSNRLPWYCRMNILNIYCIKRT